MLTQHRGNSEKFRAFDNPDCYEAPGVGYRLRICLPQQPWSGPLTLLGAVRREECAAYAARPFAELGAASPLSRLPTFPPFCVCHLEAASVDPARIQECAL
ncbi:unnamed protein product, partial [Iphiclides podalirius]